MTTTIIVCPDCGQRYDPAKAAALPRVRARDGRTIKPSRAEAQDVRRPGHKASKHHAMHVKQTQQIRERWMTQVPLSNTLVSLDECEGIAVDAEEYATRAFARRMLDAARMVARLSFPWWVCWLTVNGYSRDEIALGIAPTRNLFAGYREPPAEGSPLFDRSAAW